MSAPATAERLDLLHEWAASGLMALTGREKPDASPAGFYAAFVTEVAEVATGLGLAPGSPFADAALLLGARAAERGFVRQGTISANGTARLLPAGNSWWAISLARPSDVELVPALLERAVHETEVWEELARETARRGDELADRAAMLGLPAARLAEARGPAVTVSRIAPPAPISLDGALVVDFSALWAGPLTSALLRLAGATVVKVEWTSRPDRTISDSFFHWLNHGKLSFAVADRTDEELLSKLVDSADIVIESSRPRALRQKGLNLEKRRTRPGLIWVRITGHGRGSEVEHRCAFGDDAAVAGGLVAGDRIEPSFVGDAIADPLTGVRAAREVLRSVARGGGEVIDISMSGVAAEYASTMAPVPDVVVERSCGRWWIRAGEARIPVREPRRLAWSAPAAPLGRDNALVSAMIRERP